MKMQHELLYDKFDDDTTTDESVGFIADMLGGDSVHRAGALKAGLRKGLPRFAFLRCPYYECDLHHNATHYRSLGSGLKCPRDHSGRPPYLECASCGASRNSFETPSCCQKCRKRFR